MNNHRDKWIIYKWYSFCSTSESMACCFLDRPWFRWNATGTSSTQINWKWLVSNLKWLFWPKRYHSTPTFLLPWNEINYLQFFNSEFIHIIIYYDCIIIFFQFLYGWSAQVIPLLHSFTLRTLPYNTTIHSVCQWTAFCAYFYFFKHYFSFLHYLRKEQSFPSVILGQLTFRWHIPTLFFSLKHKQHRCLDTVYPS